MSAARKAIKLNSCQERALETLEAGGNIFLTGGAGTGKSFLLSHYMRTSKSVYPILASTGAAAVLVGGRTFHSFFGLGILEGGPEKTIEKALKNRRVTHRLKKADGVIIDEISMISATALNTAEAIARRSRGRPEPWGGLRVIAVGDFGQLPPVTRDGQPREWAFMGRAWHESNFTNVVLRTIERAHDETFARILNFIRDGVVNDDVKRYLDERVGRAPEGFQGTRLFARRDPTERFNLECLGKLETELHSFPTLYTGTDKAVEDLKRSAPVVENLQLKVGAVVMIRMNDPEGRWVNGTTGVLQKISKDALSIELEDGDEAEVEPVTFSLLDADGEKIASATNFPVSLAYAATIHKAQGMTLDKMVVDLRQLWEPGQAYVALSRVRSGEDLIIEGWHRNSVIVDPAVVAFYQRMQ